MPDKIGDYQIRVGTKAIHFWPLAPGTTVAAATPAPAPPVAAGAPNTVAVPPAFGIFDVLIAPSQDPTVKTAVTPAAPAATITATPTTASMPLIPDGGGLIRISFAVPVTGAAFTGTLRFTARRGTAAPGTAVTVDIPIRIAAGALISDLCVFFVVHPHPPANYAWVKLQAVEQSNAATAVGAAQGVCRVLRDNQNFAALNREIILETDAGGFVCQLGTTRNILGLPLGWPLNFTLAKTGFITRGHLVKLAQANVHDNTAPFVSTPPVRMMREAGASLAARTILVDAGHGVVYAHPARRSQEWYVAHKIADRIIALLTAPPFNVPAANIFRTRSAGFGLIEPAHVTASNAPEAGEARFEFDLPAKRVRAKVSAVGLKTISDLLLTRHDATTNAALPVTAAERQTVLAANAATLTAIETRLNAKLAPSKRVRPGSMRWDATADDYVYTEEPNPPPPPPPPAGANKHLPIAGGTSGDWFSLDATHLDVLAERAARWSLAAEIGGGPGADPATGRPAFAAAARSSMAADGAIAYMKAAILAYLAVTPPHVWLNHGIKAWGPTTRNDFFNTTPCDLYLTLHENAGGGVGGTALVALPTTGADAAPQDQIRIGKFFLKHVDGFQQGLRQGGVAREEPTNPATMLRSGNHIRDKYYYLESEFMDRTSAVSADRYQLQDMIELGYIDTLAQQIVRGIVEVLLDRQANMDSITLNSAFTLW